MNTEQERVELLPCPFCGSTNIEIQISTPDREGVPTNLMCSDCGASGPWEYEQGNSHAKADDAWNRRAAMQSQDREDAARLDFLIAKEATVEEMSTDRHGTHYRVRWPYLGEAITEWSRSPREAIDHARRIEGDGE